MSPSMLTCWLCVYPWLITGVCNSKGDMLNRDGVTLASKAMRPTKGTMSSQMPSSMLTCRVYLFRYGISLVGDILSKATRLITLLAARTRLHKVRSYGHACLQEFPELPYFIARYDHIDAPAYIGCSNSTGSCDHMDTRAYIDCSNSTLRGAMIWFTLLVARTRRHKVRSYGDLFREGDTIGVVLNMDLGTLRFARNGRDLGVAVQGLEGTLYPAFSMYNRYRRQSVTLPQENQTPCIQYVGSLVLVSHRLYFVFSCSFW